MGNTENITVYFDLPSNYTIEKTAAVVIITSENEKTYITAMSAVLADWSKSTIIPDLEEKNHTKGAAAYWNNY